MVNISGLRVFVYLDLGYTRCIGVCGVLAGDLETFLIPTSHETRILETYSLSPRVPIKAPRPRNSLTVQTSTLNPARALSIPIFNLFNGTPLSMPGLQFNLSLAADVTEEEKKSVARADATEVNRKRAKSISYPEMDTDGLPSSYTIKILSMLSKWQLKMDDLSQQLDNSHQSMRLLLDAKGFYEKHFSCLCSCCMDPAAMHSAYPRLIAKSTEVSKSIAGLITKISDLQSAGLSDGYTQEYLRMHLSKVLVEGIFLWMQSRRDVLSQAGRSVSIRVYIREDYVPCLH